MTTLIKFCLPSNLFCVMKEMCYNMIFTDFFIISKHFEKLLSYSNVLHLLTALKFLDKFRLENLPPRSIAIRSLPEPTTTSSLKNGYFRSIFFFSSAFNDRKDYMKCIPTFFTVVSYFKIKVLGNKT